MTVIDNLIDLFLKEGRAEKESIIGCTPNEILEIEASQDVKLPSSYKEFLSKMGKRAGYLSVGTTIFYPGILRLKIFMTELLEEYDSVAFRLPPNAFVFKSHQGYMYSYFICNSTDDPIVYNYVAGHSLPIKLELTYTEWLAVVAESEWDIEKRLPPRHKLK